MKKNIIVFLLVFCSRLSSNAQSSYFAAAGSPDTVGPTLSVHLNWGAHVLNTDSFTYVFEKGFVRFEKDGNVSAMIQSNLSFTQVKNNQRTKIDAIGFTLTEMGIKPNFKTILSELTFEGRFTKSTMYNVPYGYYQTGKDFEYLKNNQKIIVGHIGDTNSKHSAWIMKTDSANAVLWSNVAANENANRFKKVFVDKAENIYAIG